MKRSRVAISIATVATTLTSTALLTTATATAAPTVSDPIAEHLVGPLQMDVAGDRVVVAQTFIGELDRVKPDGSLKPLHTEKNGEVAGVAIDGRDVAFLTTSHDEENPASFLKVRMGDGSVRKVANLFKYEQEANPDTVNTYGFQDLDQACEDQLPDQPGLAPYTGIIESHPYGLENAPGGGWYVADAAANAILKVTPRGAVSTVAVLPEQPTVVTQEAAEANGLPECTIGETIAFEPVPTDVEVNRDGLLIVSLLPGGPEDPSFGARGQVVQVKPATGKVKTLAGGFAGATNVAVAGGRIFVSELFGGKIDKILQDAEVVPFVDATTPAALEWSDGKLYAAVDVFNEQDGGSIVTITP